MSNWPWWLLITIFLGLLIVYSILTNQRTQSIFLILSRGLMVTVMITLSAFSLALIVGLLVGLGRVSQNQIIFNLAAFYVEVVRGIPILVLLIYIAFVGVPVVVDGINAVGTWLVNSGLGFGSVLTAFRTRDISFTVRASVALGLAYGAFEAETFRAGIQSIERGQVEASRALGMSYFQSMRHVVLPQAIRRVLPVLGNDFVAMVKDSSLASVLGVNELTQGAKLYASSTFLFFQTYSMLAFMYLFITIMLTRLVRLLEARLAAFRNA